METKFNPTHNMTGIGQIDVPVIILAASDAKKHTKFAYSSTSPKRFIGIKALICLLISIRVLPCSLAFDEFNCSKRSVSKKPVNILLTVMLN